MSEITHRFVGINPHIEQQCWEEFHQHMTAAIQAQLLPQLLPRGYDATLKQRIYLERAAPNEMRRLLRPDVAVHTEKRPPQEGQRLPTLETQPEGDYYVYISRAERRPRVLVIAWQLNHRLPRIPIPLLQGDPDATLDLQSAYEDAFARARYDLRLRYD
ncbi:MAG: DUF4058 family protein [Fimbriimonadales bacterium]|nr:DUF4058 family protein [Fimbriimonadales bacterium]